jgi:hypothetical protein
MPQEQFCTETSRTVGRVSFSSNHATWRFEETALLAPRGVTLTLPPNADESALETFTSLLFCFRFKHGALTALKKRSSQ